MTTDSMERYIDFLFKIFCIVFITAISGVAIWACLKIIYILVMIPVNYLWH